MCSHRHVPVLPRFLLQVRVLDLRMGSEHVERVEHTRLPRAIRTDEQDELGCIWDVLDPKIGEALEVPEAQRLDPHGEHRVAAQERQRTRQLAQVSAETCFEVLQLPQGQLQALYFLRAEQSRVGALDAAR